MRGIISYGGYVPYHRLDRRAIAEVLGSGSGRGFRSVANYDEDTTSMGVEAGRAALASLAPGVHPASLYFATADPAYLDKTNATAIHAALALEPSVFAADMAGSVRSGAGAFKAALDARQPAMAVLSDIRTGLPGSGDEANGGDGAVAFVCGEGDQVIAEYLGGASATEEFLDRWRIPGQHASLGWEERFGEYVYVPLARQVLANGLKATGTTAEHLDCLVVASVSPRAARTVIASAGVRKEAIADDLSATVGNTGTAHLGLMLADALDRAQPNQLIAVLLLADGADLMLFRTTEAIAGYKRTSTVAEQIASSRPVSYASFLTWRNFLVREGPRRPDPDRPGAPNAFRAEDWKFGFSGSRCQACGFRHLPPSRVCVHCHAVDQMASERIADLKATVATYTVDRLAFSPAPPLVAAVIDFEGGGRFNAELTDVDPERIGIGDKVEMTFRRLYTAQSIHNYFWKARPIRRAS
ncbi:MAG: hydroxymethylglutaryl-CoA synthase family protein [Chloroflexi bacterium]|nr:hydroxymethylglutaryl-CoA synthase family protein [Chloroflexota bacterium]